MEYHLPAPDKIVVDGIDINRRRTKDADGNKLTTKTEAIRAREAAIAEARIERKRQTTILKRRIKEVFGINYKYHYLRHTYGTLMAEMNTPTHLLCNHMGYGNIHVTQLYYLAVSKSGIEVLQRNLNRL